VVEPGATLGDDDHPDEFLVYDAADRHHTLDELGLEGRCFVVPNDLVPAPPV
jgi:hypothetical protein